MLKKIFSNLILAAIAVVIVLTVSSFICSSCVSGAQVKDLPNSNHVYDSGPVPYSYFVHTPKIEFAGVDGAYLHFDIYTQIDLRNNTNRPLYVDVQCSYGKHGKVLFTKVVKDIYLKPISSKLVKMWRYFTDFSVNGYGANCRAIFYRVR